MKDAGLPALLVSVRHRFYLFICAFAAMLFFGEVWVCEFPKNFFHVDVPVLRRDYFFINRRIFKLDLTSAQTRMYLFFCKCSESRSKRFWNSYNDIICRSLKLKRSAVIKTISELLILGLIKKYRIRKKDGSFSDNHYRIISLKPPKYKY